MRGDNIIGVLAGTSGEAISRELKKWGYKVVVVSGNTNEKGFNVADLGISTDLSNKDVILNFFKMHGVKNVVVATGHILAIKLAAYLEENGIKINVNPQVSLLCKDKHALKVEAEKMGLHTPRYIKLEKNSKYEDSLEGVGYPVVVKSIKDIVLPQLIHSKEELLEELNILFKNEESIMLEEYVRGNDCSVIVSNKGGICEAQGVQYWSKAKDDGLKGFFESYSEELPKDVEKKVVEAAETLVRNTNTKGLSRVDIIVKDETPYILEVNSIIYSNNTGSLYTITSRRNGINMPKIIVENAIYEFCGDKINDMTKKDDVLVFVDTPESEEIKGLDYEKVNILQMVQNTPVIPEGNLWPDAITLIKTFGKEFLVDCTEEELDQVLAYTAYINYYNPDVILNHCSGRKKMLIDCAMAFYGRSI